MEQKKFDFNSIIGFTLIFGIMMYIMYTNQPSQAEIDAEKAKKEQEIKTVTASETEKTKAVASDSSQVKAMQASLGSFAYSASLPSAKNEFTTLENELVILKIANKGGYIAEATLKNFKSIDKNGPLVQLIKENNANLNIALLTKEGKVLNTKELFFEPTLSKADGNQILSMKLKAGQDQFLEYKYVLKANDYMLDFDVRSQGLASVLNTSNPANLEWNLKAYRNEKSISYENTLTEMVYEYEDGKDNYLGQSDEEEEVNEVSYVAFKQHFFTSILLTEKPFKTAKLASQNLIKDEEVDSVFTKNFKASLPLAFNNGELDYKMNWYYGPADYQILNNYDKNLDEIVPLGWGIFGWINKFIFVPLFGFIGTFMSYGIAIIVFTILIKMAMSPITYKSFLSQAKMKVLRPELNEINEKFKDPVKRQQETMKLYNKAGVNPMAGCIPALIQMPFMFASFKYFPAAIELRQKGFLWAEDLSSYDAVLQLPFRIPLYGNHVSLLPILAAIAIFFYMKYTTGDQQMAAPQQEGMPDMGKIMKMMIYISPIMMLIFFNNYGSGLSLYNLFSNLMTLGIMFYIKNYVVDEQRIHAQIQENKLKEPKKPSKFQQKLQEAMEQAEAHKKAKGNK
ncbi:membrane protein insertase YidC [Flavobacterium luminosum]|uniref:Membrane protein insertase YidC n=1 Tax=Flavobacterium luminosum TaxID=2949086 RepID=A0ABT0TN72_9FLAO|nr:membrane protein insertase YidC [Flavobacterium sp. HXWNR70]MCL9808943.1 membrane protein insertase YidC [Flavobacterium sp. HXWNR70]